MAVVYILGAGASYGDELLPLPDVHDEDIVTAKVPLANGFFDGELLRSSGFSGRAVELKHAEAIRYTRQVMSLEEQVGEGRWNSLSLEQVLTHIDLEMEFLSPSSRDWITRLSARNDLIDYVYRILGLCTMRRYGKYSRRLVSNLQPDDSLITFNWDLLIDQEFNLLKTLKHYDDFLARVNGTFEKDYRNINVGTGLYFKLHGSLNWFQCTNDNCPSAKKLLLNNDTQLCLDLMAFGSSWGICPQCGNKTKPLLVPPILGKPVKENWIIRSTWGLARRALQDAEKVVVVGFSFTPSDFFAEWLLRSTCGSIPGKTFIVNPCCQKGVPEEEFKKRMKSVFPQGYNADFFEFSQIEEIIARVRAA